MIEELRELWRFRELLWTMVQRELRIRYKNSALGFLWSFINPLVTTLVLTLVFTYFIPNGVQSFSAYVLAAYLPFMFFQFSVLDSAQAVLSQIPLVKKIYFPREVLPLSVVIANFIHLLMGFGVFFVFLLVVWATHPGQSPFRATALWLPVLLLISFMLSAGLGLLVSALNTFYEDVKYVVSVLLYLLFFLCPVMYFSETVAYSRVNRANDGLIYTLYNLNPIASLSTLYRQALLAPQSILIPGAKEAQAPVILDGKWLVYVAIVSFVTMVFGYSVFNRLKWKFVERP